MNSHCAIMLGATILPSFRSRKLHGEVLPRCFWDAMTRAWLGNGWENAANMEVSMGQFL